MSVTRPTSNPPAPTGRTAGIDWASKTHAIAICDPDGEPVKRFTASHDASGIKTIIKELLRADVDAVGIERPDGPVVEALRAADLTVYVIAPGQLRNLRGRYGSAGNKDDRFDAFVLADVVRTDRRRLTPLLQDREETTALRSLVRARKDLIAHRVGLANQLRAHLQIVFPGAATLFADIDSAITRAFLRDFSTPDALRGLGPARLDAWLHAHAYSGRVPAGTLLARLRSAPAGISGPAADIHARTTTAFIAALDAICTQIRGLAEAIAEQLDVHPDGHIFTSLPRSGTVRAARLLAEIGDARGRFPTANSLAALAGVAPSTRESGTVRIVSFRWAVDKQLRDALTDFAGDSRHANAWAADLYRRSRARGHDHPHAVRVLARAWVDVIWRCWQDEEPYEPVNHRALQRVLAASQTEAA